MVLLCCILLAPLIPCLADSPSVSAYTLSQLGSNDNKIQQQAVDRLIKQGNAVISKVLTLANNPKARVRLGMMLVLFSVPDERAYDVLVHALHDSNAKVREIAYYALRKCPSPKQVDRLLQALHNPDGEVVEDALQQLKTHYDPRFASALVALLRRVDWQKFLPEVCTFFYTGGYILSTEQALSLLEGSEPGPKILAAQVLSEDVDPRVEPALIKYLNDPIVDIRRNVADALGRSRDPLVLAGMITRLHDVDETVREAAARSLGKMCSKQAIDPLIATLSDPSPAVRSAILVALRDLHAMRDIPAILPLLNDSDKNIRDLAASMVIRVHNPQEARKVLAELKDKQDDDSAWDIIQQLYYLPDNSLLEPLLEMAKGASPLRDYALTLLGGYKDPRAVEALLTALKNPDLQKNGNPTCWFFPNDLRLKDPRVVDALIAILHSENAKNNNLLGPEICRFISESGDKRALQPLLDYLPHSTVNADWCVQAIIRLADNDFSPVEKRIEDYINSSDEHAVMLAATILIQRRDGQALPALLKGLQRVIALRRKGDIYYETEVSMVKALYGL